MSSELSTEAEAEAETDAETAVEVSREEARELLVDLVATPSVSGDEGACAEVLVEFFEEHDREVRVDEVGNVHAPGEGVLLTSHVDTVPGEIPVRVEETGEGEVLWGRGSVDAKGPLATMAVVAVTTGASFLGVVGEEVDQRGSRHAVEVLEEPAAVVNGEPSGWEGVTLGYRGLLEGTYRTATDSVHSSRPENNAVQDAVEWCDRVKRELETATDAGPDEAFESLTFTPTAFDGGTAPDGFAVEATVEFQVRVPPEKRLVDVRAAVEAQLQGGSVEWTDGVEPVLVSPRTPAARAFRVAVRNAGGDPRLLCKSGTSDMNIFAAHWDCPMVTYGPGDSALDHAPDERLPLAEYERAVGVLEDATTQLLENEL